MNETLQIILHSDPTVLAALVSLIGVLGAAVGYVIKQLGDARAKAIVATADADAKVKVTSAEVEKTEAETTGRFVTLAEKDRQQIDALVSDVRVELKRCDEERRALKAEMIEQAARYEAEIAKLRERVAVLERSRASLWDELQKVRRAIASGGAYPIPAELPGNVVEEIE